MSDVSLCLLLLINRTKKNFGYSILYVTISRKNTSDVDIEAHYLFLVTVNKTNFLIHITTTLIKINETEPKKSLFLLN